MDDAEELWLAAAEINAIEDAQYNEVLSAQRWNLADKAFKTIVGKGIVSTILYELVPQTFDPEFYKDVLAPVPNKRKYDGEDDKLKKIKLDHKLIIDMFGAGSEQAPTLVVKLSNGGRKGHLAQWEKDMLGPVRINKMGTQSYNWGTGAQLNFDSVSINNGGSNPTNVYCEMSGVFVRGFDFLQRNTANADFVNAYKTANVTSDSTNLDVGEMLHISSYYSKVTLVNTSNVTITILAIVARVKSGKHEQLPESFKDSWAEMVAQASVTSGGTGNLGVQGQLTTSLATGEVSSNTTSGVDVYGQHPENQPEMKRQWKFKTVRMQLSPGAKRSVMVCIPPTRLKSADLNGYRANQVINYINNYSYSLHFICRGAPVFDTSNLNANSFSGGSVSVYKQDIFSYRCLPLTHKRKLTYGALTEGISSTLSVSNARVVNPETEAPMEITADTNA